MSTYDDGLKVLGALARYCDLIMTAYEQQSGHFDYNEHTARAIDDMVRLRLAVFDSPNNGQPRLNSAVTALLDLSLRTSRLKMVNADVGVAVEGIEFLANEYLAAKQVRSSADAQSHLNDLDANVAALCDNLVEQARGIWRQIDSDFGSVTLLASKIALNKNALNKVRKLLESLDLIPLETLYDLGMRDKELRAILQVRLPKAVDNCRKDLSDALHRLNKMLFKLNQLESRARMVNEFLAFCDQPNTDGITDFSQRSEVPELFLAIEPLITTGAADPGNAALELDFTEIISGLRKQAPPDEPQKATPVSVSLTNNQLEQLIVSPFKDAVRKVFF